MENTVVCKRDALHAGDEVVNSVGTKIDSAVVNKRHVGLVIAVNPIYKLS